jgi:subtilisin-like proprotein convertase family protein
MKTRFTSTAALVMLILFSAWTPAVRVQGEIVRFYEGQFDLLIPADADASKGWMEDAIIEVPHHLTVHDLDVSVSLTHTNVFDLQLFVESPSGTQVLLNMYDPYTGYAKMEDYQGTIFDDEADTPIGDASAPFQGRFIPLESLAAFDGEDAYGQWRLHVYDSWAMDTGHLDAFGLAVTVPEPATTAFVLLGVGLAGFCRRFR